MHKQLIVDVADIARRRLVCGQCRSAISVLPGSGDSFSCPSCRGTIINRQLADSVAKLAEALQTLQKHAPTSVQFEVQASEPKESER